MTLNKLVIIGVGLIGGSFALALRQAGRVREVVGVGRSAANLQEALRRGAINDAQLQRQLQLGGITTMADHLPHRTDRLQRPRQRAANETDTDNTEPLNQLRARGRWPGQCPSANPSGRPAPAD